MSMLNAITATLAQDSHEFPISIFRTKKAKEAFSLPVSDTSRIQTEFTDRKYYNERSRGAAVAQRAAKATENYRSSECLVQTHQALPVLRVLFVFAFIPLTASLIFSGQKRKRAEPGTYSNLLKFQKISGDLSTFSKPPEPVERVRKKRTEVRPGVFSLRRCHCVSHSCVRCVCVCVRVCRGFNTSRKSSAR